MWVSPRKRAQETFHLLFDRKLPDEVEATENIAEWDYGDYEGLLVQDIRSRRKEKGLDREREWSIWRDGCEGGEYISPRVLPGLALGGYIKVTNVMGYFPARQNR